MKRVVVDFDNPLDYDYDSGGTGINGDLVIGENSNVYFDELTLLNGSTRWRGEFTPPTQAFAAESDYLQIPSSSQAFQWKRDFSSEIWLKLTSNLNTNEIRTFWSSGDTSYFAQWYFRYGISEEWDPGIRLNFGYYDGGYRNYFSDEIDFLFIGVWHHIALTRKDGKLRFFLNGKSLGMRTYGQQILPIGDFRIGCREDRGKLVEFSADYFDEISIDNSDYRWEEDFLRPQEPNLTPISLNHTGGHLRPGSTTIDINIDISNGTWEEAPSEMSVAEIVWAEVVMSDSITSEDVYEFHIFCAANNALVRKGLLDKWWHSIKIDVTSNTIDTTDFYLIGKDFSDYVVHFNISNPVEIVDGPSYESTTPYSELNLQFEKEKNGWMSYSWGDSYYVLSSPYFSFQITGGSGQIGYTVRSPGGYSLLKGITDANGNAEHVHEKNFWFFDEYDTYVVSASDDTQGTLWVDSLEFNTTGQTFPISTITYPDYTNEVDFDVATPATFSGGTSHVEAFDAEFPKVLNFETNEDYTPLPVDSDHGGMFVTASDCDQDAICALGGCVYEMNGRYIVRAHWNLINYMFLPRDGYTSSPTTLLEALEAGGFFTSPTVVEFSEEIQIGYVLGKDSQPLDDTTGFWDITFSSSASAYVDTFSRVFLKDNAEYGPNSIRNQSDGSYIQYNSVEEYWEHSGHYFGNTSHLQGIITYAEQMCSVLIKGSAITIQIGLDLPEEGYQYVFTPDVVDAQGLSDWSTITNPATDPKLGIQQFLTVGFHLYYHLEGNLVPIRAGKIDSSGTVQLDLCSFLRQPGDEDLEFSVLWTNHYGGFRASSLLEGSTTSIIPDNIRSHEMDFAVSRDINFDPNSPWDKNLSSFYSVEVPRPIVRILLDGLPVVGTGVGISYEYPPEYKHILARTVITDSNGEVNLKLAGMEEEFYVFTTQDSEGQPYYGYRDFSPDMEYVLVTMLLAETSENTKEVNVEIDLTESLYTPGDLYVDTTLPARKTGVLTQNSENIRSSLTIFDPVNYKVQRRIGSLLGGRFHYNDFLYPQSGDIEILAHTTDESTYADKVSPVMDDGSTDITIDINNPAPTLDNSKEFTLDFNDLSLTVGPLLGVTSYLPGISGTITVDLSPYDGAKLIVIDSTTYQPVTVLGTNFEGKFRQEKKVALSASGVELLSIGPDNYDFEASDPDLAVDATGVTVDLTEEDHPGISLESGPYGMLYLDFNTPDTWVELREGVDTRGGYTPGYGTSDTVVFPRWRERYDQAITADSPLAYWRVNESAGPTAADFENSYDGTYTGTVTYSQTGAPTDGASDTAALLDGSSAYINLGNVDDFEISSFSFEIWVKPSVDWDNTLGNDVTVASFVPSIYNGWSLSYIKASEHFQFASGDGSTPWKGINSSTVTLTSGIWYHLVVTYNGTIGKIYLDTLPVASDSLVTPTWTGTDPYLIGAYSGGSLYLPGTVDEVAFYDSVLTYAQVDHHYEVGTVSTVSYHPVDLMTLSLTPLVASYQFDKNFNVDASTVSFTLLAASAVPYDSTMIVAPLWSSASLTMNPATVLQDQNFDVGTQSISLSQNSSGIGWIYAVTAERSLTITPLTLAGYIIDQNLSVSSQSLTFTIWGETVAELNIGASTISMITTPIAPAGYVMDVNYDTSSQTLTTTPQTPSILFDNNFDVGIQSLGLTLNAFAAGGDHNLDVGFSTASVTINASVVSTLDDAYAANLQTISFTPLALSGFRADNNFNVNALSISAAIYSVSYRVDKNFGVGASGVSFTLNTSTYRSDVNQTSSENVMTATPNEISYRIDVDSFIAGTSNMTATPVNPSGYREDNNFDVTTSSMSFGFDLEGVTVVIT